MSTVAMASLTMIMVFE